MTSPPSLSLSLSLSLSFSQALIRQWEQYAADVKKVKGELVSIPDKVLSSTELVLDEDGELQDVNRMYGENEVGRGGGGGGGRGGEGGREGG